MINEHDYLQRVVPLTAQWDITQGCNFRCSFCLTASSSPGREELNTQQAFELIDKLYDAGILFLKVLGGEPFFRADTRQILRYAAKKGMLLSFSTNASLLDEGIVSSLADIRDRIHYLQVSLYGIDEASYHRTTQVKKSCELLTRGLRLLQTHEFKFTALTVATESNVDVLDAYYGFAAEHGADEFRICPQVSLGRAVNLPAGQRDFDDDLWLRLLQSLRRVAAARDSCGIPVRFDARPMLGRFIQRETGLDYYFEVCKAARTMLHIDASGRSRPCPALDYLPASLKERFCGLTALDLVSLPFKEVWESDAFNRFRDYYHPKRNPAQFNMDCPDFRQGVCIPCPITPCTCAAIIRLLHVRDKRSLAETA